MRFSVPRRRLLLAFAWAFALGSCSLDSTVHPGGGRPGRDGSVHPPGCIPEDPPIDLCNGDDDDCDTATPDGSQDPMVGISCDGDADTDSCPEGSWECIGGDLVCDDATTNTSETCDGADEDCDGRVDEMPTDGMVVYGDADGDGYGVRETTSRACAGSIPPGWAAMSGDCNDASRPVSPAAIETCDGTDENCNGLVDDHMTCGCGTETWRGHAYSYCYASVSWDTALSRCGAIGQRLVVIEDTDENVHVHDRVRAIGGGGFWIGLTDWIDEGRFSWESGATSGFRAWYAGEPNNGDCIACLGEDCVEIASYDSYDSWNDAECFETRRFACESL